MPEIILVVDDEPVVLKIVSEILSIRGFEVLRAASAEEALDTARRRPGPIHLLVCDVVMPGLGGPDLAEAMQQLHPETECLFIAGLPDSPQIYERILTRGRAFLPKPFAARTLLAKVDEVLGRETVGAR